MYWNCHLHLSNESDDTLHANAEVLDQKLETQIDLGEDGKAEHETELGNKANTDLDHRLRGGYN